MTPERKNTNAKKDDLVKQMANLTQQEPQFKQEFFCEFVNPPKYEIYTPMNFYVMLLHKLKDHSTMLRSDEYRRWGGVWLAEFIDDELTNYWHFDYYQQAKEWKRAKEQTQGKAEIVFPKIERPENPYKNDKDKKQFPKVKSEWKKD